MSNESFDITATLKQWKISSTNVNEIYLKNITYVADRIAKKNPSL
jgi:hypothetical protein